MPAGVADGRRHPGSRDALVAILVAVLLLVSGISAAVFLRTQQDGPGPEGSADSSRASLSAPGMGLPPAEAHGFEPARTAPMAANETPFEEPERYDDHPESSGGPAPGGAVPPDDNTPPSEPADELVTPAPPPPPTPPNTFACPGGPVTEPRPTDGEDAGTPGLQWMALKTGFRLAVVWTSTVPTMGSLDYRVGLTAVVVQDAAATRFHFFVVDGLPVGDELCFQVSDAVSTSAWHGLYLRNAFTQYDPSLGAYQVNLLALADQGSDLAEIEDALPEFANLIWDATDGHVRAGRFMVVSANLLRENVGWQHCFIDNGPDELCHYLYDVIFTYDAYSGGAASTYLNGVSDPRVSIWMNWQYEAAPAPVKMLYQPADVGDVLAHEFGHYGFGMNDQWGTDGSNCSDPTTGISIMGGSGTFYETEYDDSFNRCPNEAYIPGYVPGWTRLRATWPLVPDRLSVPTVGPSGDGGVFARAMLSAV